MVLSKNLLSLGVLAASVEPAGGLRQEPSEAKNQGREENLQPDGDGPALVARKVDGATSDTSSEKRTDEPVLKLGLESELHQNFARTRTCCRDQ